CAMFAHPYASSFLVITPYLFHLVYIPHLFRPLSVLHLSLFLLFQSNRLHVLLFRSLPMYLLFFFTDPSTTEIYTLSLHDALPIYQLKDLTKGNYKGYLGVDMMICRFMEAPHFRIHPCVERSEEHTSELQSRFDLVCRLLLEKKKKETKHTLA